MGFCNNFIQKQSYFGSWFLLVFLTWLPMFFSFTFMLTFITLIVNIFDMIFMLYATQIGKKEIIETSSNRERFLYVCNFSFYWVNLLFFLFQVFVNKQLLKWQLQQLIKAKRAIKINLTKKNQFRNRGYEFSCKIANFKYIEKQYSWTHTISEII